MRVVIDTNVVVSAALKDRDPELVILFIVDKPDIEWIASVEIVAEYHSVLTRPKFALPEAMIERWREVFQSATKIIELPPTVEFPRDPKDAKFLACALAADADYLITGDKDFSVAHKFSSTTVLSVSQFKTLICDNW